MNYSREHLQKTLNMKLSPLLVLIANQASQLYAPIIVA
jgi:hypothetical protein